MCEIKEKSGRAPRYDLMMNPKNGKPEQTNLKPSRSQETIREKKKI